MYTKKTRFVRLWYSYLNLYSIKIQTYDTGLKIVI